MRSAEYTSAEMKNFLGVMSEMYDIARLVDPVECRVIEIADDGSIEICESCYGVWQSEQRCVNCPSFVACKTGNSKNKIEHFHDNVYNIQSKPVKLRLNDGTAFEGVVELIDVHKDERGEGFETGNDRAAEDQDHMADRYQARHDTLTGVLNVEAFFEFARKKLNRHNKVSWVMISVNIMEFRLVNNFFGPDRGNEVLVDLADMLDKMSKSAGGLCCRVNADQFAVFMPEDSFDEDKLIEIAEKLASSIESGVYSLRTHFGIYEITDYSLPIAAMLDRANMALRTIHKDLNKTIVFFDNSIMTQILHEQEVVSSFEKAKQEGQFKIFLQPLTDSTGKPFGAEALVRWIRPNGEIVAPGEFIGILEDTGMIAELDKYVWELAVMQLDKWKGTDKEGLTISVNISAKDFYYIDVCKVLTDLIKKYDVDSSRLRVEITETAMLYDVEAGARIIDDLRKAGFYIEIDDFGKGQSSLSMLKDINADLVKIDMGFLHETVNQDRSRIILGAIIDMADSLGMELITEGVETQEQLQSLMDMGCKYFQGYYFSKPISVEEFEEKYKSRV